MLRAMVSFFHLILLAQPCLSWTVPAYMDLVWPPPGLVDYHDNWLQSCLNLDVPKNITRTLFPIQGGRFELALVNKTGGSPDDYFRIDMYLAHVYKNSGAQANLKNRNVLLMQPWENFATGRNCSRTFDMTKLFFWSDGSTNTNATVADLNGLNVTMALQIMLLNNHRGVEQMDECAYLTLVPNEQFDTKSGGPCNSDLSANPTPESTPKTSVGPVGGPYFMSYVAVCVTLAVCALWSWL